MSFWTRVREWLSDPPPGVPDVASFPDTQLEKLWKERQDLTELAREAVKAECLKRGLPLEAVPRAPPPPDDEERERVVESGPRPSGNVIDVRAKCGVLLQTTPGRFVLVVLPRWDPAPIELPDELQLDAMIICNHEPRGWLDGSAWAARLKVSLENVYATADGPIDRSPTETGGAAKHFPSQLVLGSLTLRRMGTLKNVLRAKWKGAALTAAIGPMLPAALVNAQPESLAYVGSLSKPEESRAWSLMLMAAQARAVMKVAGHGSGAAGPVVILVGDAVGAPVRWHTHMLPGLGFSVVGAECPVAPDTVAMLGDVFSGKWDKLAASDAMGDQLEDVMEHLIVEARMDDAWRLIAGLFPRREAETTLQRLRATLHALDGQHDEALALLTRADVDPFSRVIASAVHAARCDWGAAEREARRALEAMPGDPHAMGALVRSLWLAGRMDDARKLIDEAPAFSLTGTQASDLYSVIERAPPGEGTRAPGLPHLAARALVIARRAQDPELAQRAYRRALALDPDCTAAAEALSG